MGLLPMEADILPPSDDRVFKLILTSEDAKPVLMDLISSIIKRDGYRCALCDSTRYLQIHHYVPRGQGGNSPHNLITLCSDCHALAHGTKLRDWKDITQEEILQDCTEYLADYYTPGWNPWAENPQPSLFPAPILD